MFQCFLIASFFVLRAGAEFNLTVVHIGDFHSHWFEFNKYEQVCDRRESMAGECFGGFPRLLTKVQEIRQKEKNVLVLSSGEFFYGQSYNAAHGWRLANYLLPILKLDAMSLSNHDFDDGILELSAFLYGQQFPVLCANMWSRSTSFLNSRLNKSAILDVNGHKVGIVGYLHPDVLKISRRAVSVKFFPELPAVESEVKELREQGVNKIIALGHSGYDTDMEIARKVKDVDIVIGGNSDIVLGKQDKDGSDESVERNLYENYPHLHHHDVEAGVEHRNRTLVLHVPQHGKYIGVVRVTFDDNGVIVRESGEPVLLDQMTPQDEQVLEYLRSTTKNLEEVGERYPIPDRDKELATVDDVLKGGRSCRMGECSLGNLLVDAMLYGFDNHPEWGVVDAAVLNSGMIRYSIPPGSITLRKLFHSVFTGDLIMRVYMPGIDLVAMMENSVHNYDPTGISASGAFLQVAGLKIVYNMSMPVGSRVKSLAIRDKMSSNDTYVPVKPYKTYFVAMPSFIVRGNDGYATFDTADDSGEKGQPDFIVIMDYLKKLKVIYPKMDGRISFYQKNGTYRSNKKLNETLSTSSRQTNNNDLNRYEYSNSKLVNISDQKQKNNRSPTHKTMFLKSDRKTKFHDEMNPQISLEENSSKLKMSSEPIDDARSTQQKALVTDATFEEKEVSPFQSMTSSFEETIVTRENILSPFKPADLKDGDGGKTVGLSYSSSKLDENSTVASNLKQNIDQEITISTSFPSSAKLSTPTSSRKTSNNDLNRYESSHSKLVNLSDHKQKNNISPTDKTMFLKSDHKTQLHDEMNPQISLKDNSSKLKISSEPIDDARSTQQKALVTDVTSEEKEVSPFQRMNSSFEETAITRENILSPFKPADGDGGKTDKNLPYYSSKLDKNSTVASHLKHNIDQEIIISTSFPSSAKLSTPKLNYTKTSVETNHFNTTKHERLENTSDVINMFNGTSKSTIPTSITNDNRNSFVITFNETTNLPVTSQHLVKDHTELVNISLGKPLLAVTKMNSYRLKSDENNKTARSDFNYIKHGESSGIFQAANSSYGELESTVLDAVMSDMKLDFTNVSHDTLDVLEENLKDNLKKYLVTKMAVETSSLQRTENEVEKLSATASREEESVIGKYSPTSAGIHQVKSEDSVESNMKDVDVVQDLLVHSVVDSILEKVKNKLFGEGEVGNRSPFKEDAVTERKGLSLKPQMNHPEYHNSSEIKILNNKEEYVSTTEHDKIHKQL